MPTKNQMLTVSAHKLGYEGRAIYTTGRVGDSRKIRAITPL